MKEVVIVAILCGLLCIVRSEICADGGGQTVETDAYATAVDKNSNVYVVGSLSARGLYNNYSVTILGESFGGTNVGIHDVGYIAKVNPNNQNTVYVKLIELIDYSELNQPSASINSIDIKNNKVMIAGSVSGPVNIFGCRVDANDTTGGVFVAQLDLSATCKKAIVVTPYFTPFLLIDSATNHLYLYGSSVYGDAKFGDFAFSSPGSSGAAAYIAKMSWLKSFDWVVQITNLVNGQAQFITATQDIAQDDNYIYTVVQGSGTLQFCNQDLACTQAALDGYEMALVKLDKADGSVTVVALEYNATEFSVTNIGACSKTATKSEIYVGSIGNEAIVGKYDQYGIKQWQTSIPNHCCNNYRNLQSYTSRILLDSAGNVYVGGTTDSGTGVHFSISQPWVAKLRHTNGNVIFNTRADRSVSSPPDPYTYSAGIALDDDEGEVYLTGAFGCTLKFEGSTKKLKTVDSSCAPANTPDGRNTWMYLVTIDASSGQAC